MKEKHRRRKLANFQMDFGRYRGRRLAEVPREYLKWIVAESHDATIVWMVSQYIALVGNGKGTL